MSFHSIKHAVCYSLFRFILPFTLLTATMFRFNLVSFVYGCLMLVCPLIKPPSPTTIKGQTGHYLVMVVCLSSVGLITQIVFQVVVFVTRTSWIDEHSSTNCSSRQAVLLQIGLQRVTSRNMLEACRIVLPDVATFIISLVVYISCRLLHSGSASSNINHSTRHYPDHTHHSVLPARPARWAAAFAARLCSLAAPLLVALCGVATPSILSSVYFLSALGALTLWSLRVRAPVPPRAVLALRVSLLIYTAFYLVLTYLSQFLFASPLWDLLDYGTGLVGRIMGLSRFVVYTCTSMSIGLRVTEDLLWTEYLNLSLLLSLYFVLALETRQWREKRNTDMSALFIHRTLVHRSNQQNTDRCLSVEIPAQSHAMLDSVVGIERWDGDVGGHGSQHDSSLSDGLMMAGVVGATVAAGSRGAVVRERSVLKSLALYLLEQSYIGTLVVMMAWSIAYHSWLTFVLLLTACFIWIVPRKRSVCLTLSPLIVLYGETLVVLQYIYSFRLNDAELPVQTSGGYRMRAIGMVKYHYPIMPLAIKMGFTSIFLITLRYSWIARDNKRRVTGGGSGAETRRYRPTSAIPLLNFSHNNYTSTTNHQHHNSESITECDSPAFLAMGRWTKSVLCKYWIYVCMTLLLLVSLQRPRIIRIVYMGLFLICAITFQVSYRCWRYCMRGFWWVVIIYSMLIIICSYTYQFEGVPELWKLHTGLHDEQLANLGLFVREGGMLFVDLLIPTSFLIVVILQLHYFQSTFLQLTDLNRYKISHTQMRTNHRHTSVHGNGPTSHDGLKERFVEWGSGAWSRVGEVWDELSDVMWRFCEVHMYKCVVTTIFIISVHEVSVLSFVLVLVVVTTLPFKRTRRVVSVFCLVFASTVLVMKMSVQLSFIPPQSLITFCLLSDSGGNVRNVTRDSLAFIGLHKANNMAKYVASWLSIVLVLTVQSIVHYHEIQYYNHPEHSKPEPGIVFPHVHRRDADKGIVPCLKFFFNYGFHKLGREMCFVMTMITMVVRLDMFSVIYAGFLGVLLLLSRRRCRQVWPVYMTILVVLLLVQYLGCLGLPPGLCWEYPWDSLDWMSQNLKVFLFLPNYNQSSLSKKLIVDFIQLLFVCLQWEVCWIEQHRVVEFGGGSNNNILRDLKANKPNPYADFLTYKNSYLDYIKVFVYFYSFWLTLMVVFFAGTSRITLFCMGYLITCFVFLWFGEAMLLKPPQQLNRMWMGLLMYTYVVLVVKCILQLIGCVYITSTLKKGCWAVQLFNIICLQSASYEQNDTDRPVCSLSVDNAGLSWDAACFICLLLMMRICKSWYFQRIVSSLQINHQLAARGAELINSDLINRVEEMKKREVEVMRQIRDKMDRIKKRNLHQQSHNLHESEDHYIVIRSGDYYMFDDVDSDDDEALGATPSDDDIMNQGASLYHTKPGGSLYQMTPGGGASQGGPGLSCDVTSYDWREERPSVLPIDVTLFSGTREALEVVEGKRHLMEMQRSLSMSPREISIGQMSSILVDSPVGRGPLPSSPSSPPTPHPLTPLSQDGGAAQPSKQRTSGSSSASSATVRSSCPSFRPSSEPARTSGQEYRPSYEPASPSNEPLRPSSEVERPNSFRPSREAERHNSFRPSSEMERPSYDSGAEGLTEEEEVEVGVMEVDVFEGASADRAPLYRQRSIGGAIPPGGAMPALMEEIDTEPEETNTPPSTGCVAFVDTLRVVWAVLCNTVDYVISQLYNISREYRSVSRRLELERELFKSAVLTLSILESGIKKSKHSQESAHRKYVESARNVDDDDDEDDDDDDDDNARNAMEKADRIQTRKLNDSPRLSLHLTEAAMRTADVDFHAGMPRPLRVIVAIGEALTSNSDTVVYFTMILNVMLSANLLAIPYPCFIFFWALLSIPRPSKTYWVTMITYTEAVIIIKYLFQFSFFPWNDPTLASKQFSLPKFIGIQKSDMYATLDFLVLFCLFMHRVVLKGKMAMKRLVLLLLLQRHGLWKDAQDMSKDLDNLNKKLVASGTTGLTPCDKMATTGATNQRAIFINKPTLLVLTMPSLDVGGVSNDVGGISDEVDGARDNMGDNKRQIENSKSSLTSQASLKPTPDSNEPWWSWKNNSGVTKSASLCLNGYENGYRKSARRLTEGAVDMGRCNAAVSSVSASPSSARVSSLSTSCDELILRTETSSDTNSATHRQASRDTNEQIASDTNKQISGDTSRQASKDTNEEMCSDTNEQISSGITGEAHRQSSRDTNEEICSDTNEQISSDSTSDMQKQASKDTISDSNRLIIEDSTSNRERDRNEEEGRQLDRTSEVKESHSIPSLNNQPSNSSVKIAQRPDSLLPSEIERELPASSVGIREIGRSPMEARGVAGSPVGAREETGSTLEPRDVVGVMGIVGTSPVAAKEAGTSPVLVSVSESVDINNQSVSQITRALCCVSVLRNMCSNVRQFFTYLRNPQYVAVTDVYALMFACELISFIIVVFGYSSFGPSAADNEDVTSLIKQSRVPFPFLAMLLVQFVIIIVDRALYLRKQVIIKFIFHVIIVMAVHVWMFFVLPLVTDRPFTSNLAAQLWYFTKCLYFGLSCYQIRSGYPTRIIGNFLTKKYNYINLYLFKLFLVVPFLLELRSIMDWMWTDTTLALTSWLQVEDIYANIFLIKCYRRAEQRYPTQRGRPRHKCVKYGLGGLILVILTFIIWLPLLFFAMSTSIYAPNPPISVSLRISIEGYESIFHVKADQQNIRQIMSEEHSALKYLYRGYKKATAFLDHYEGKDIYMTHIPEVSENNWDITYPDEMALYSDLINASKPTITIYSTLMFSREPNNNFKSGETVFNTFPRILNRSKEEDLKVINQLSHMINNNNNNNNLQSDVEITRLLPQYVTVPSNGRVSDSKQLFIESKVTVDKREAWLNVTWTSARFSLHTHNNDRYWKMIPFTQPPIPQSTTTPPHSNTSPSSRSKPTPIMPDLHRYIVSFNDRVATGLLTFFSNYGIVGLYASFVVVINRFVRVITHRLDYRIKYDELPNPDYIFRLCRDIYYARETRDLRLEEDLFAKLLFLFRSPELMIKMAKHKVK